MCTVSRKCERHVDHNGKVEETRRETDRERERVGTWRETELAAGAGQQENSIRMSPMLKRNLLELGSCEGCSTELFIYK